MRIEFGPRGAKILVTSCKDCGTEVRRFAGMVGDGRQLRCGDCKDKLPPPNWNGYPIVWIDGKYRTKHRVAMEKKLGRKLGRHELVHHKNEDKSNYKESNLQLVTHKEHRSFHAPELTWNLKTAKRMFRKGFSFAAIARAVDTDAMTVYTYFLRNGLYIKGTRDRAHRGPHAV